MNLKHKNILITGAGKGIGLATLNDCLRQGAYIYALTRSKNDLKNFKNYKNLHIFIGDVRNEKMIKKIFVEAKKKKKTN